MKTHLLIALFLTGTVFATSQRLDESTIFSAMDTELQRSIREL